MKYFLPLYVMYLKGPSIFSKNVLNRSSWQIVLSSCFNCFLFTGGWIKTALCCSLLFFFFSLLPCGAFLFSFSPLQTVVLYLWNIHVTSAHSLSTPNRTSPNPDLSLLLFSFAFHLLKAARCSAESWIGILEIQFSCFGIIVSGWAITLLWPFLSLS